MAENSTPVVPPDKLKVRSILGSVVRPSIDNIDLGPEFGVVNILDDIVRKSLDYNAILDYRMRNPNQTLLDLGKNIRLFDEMMTDDTISSVINIKKRMVLSTPGDFRPASGDPRDIEICEFVKRTFNSLKMRWIDCMDNMLDAMVYGFQVAEKVWEVEGDFLVLRNLKFRHSLLFDYEYDEYGNLIVLHVGYYYGGQHMAVRGQDVASKFLIFVHPYPRNGIYYGQSELTELYGLWNAKRNILNWRNMYLQNYGMPITVIKYDQKTMDADELSALEDMASHLQEQQYITIPCTRRDDTDALVPKAELVFQDVAGKSSSNTEIFERAIDQLETAMKRKLLLPDKMGFSAGDSTGSYNLGEIQFDILVKSILFLQGRLEECCNKELVRQLVDYNFPDVKAYPEYRFPKIDSKLHSDMIQVLLQNGVVSPDEPWIREYTNVPSKPYNPDLATGQQINQAIPEQAITDKSRSPNAGKWVPGSIYRPGFPDYEVPHQPTPGQGYIQNIGPESQPVNQGVLANNPPGPGTPGASPGPQNIGTVSANPMQGGTYYPTGMSPVVPNRVVRSPMWSTFKKASLKDTYNFDSHQKDLDTLAADFVEEYTTIYKSLSEDFVGQIQKKKIIENHDLEAFRHINIPKGKLKDLFSQYLAKCFLTGKVNAITQIKKRLKAAKPDAFTRRYMEFAIDETNDGFDWLRRTWIDKYLRAYGDLGTLTQADKDYLKSIRDKAYLLTGQITGRIQETWQIIDNGIHDGLMERDIVAKLEQALNEDQEQYAITIARTNEAEAYNIAMMNEFMSDNVRPAIEAYMFSAIMDDRTTDVCAEQNGKIIYQGDPELAQYTPPLHFGCRSVLVPIFVGENDNPDSYFRNYNDNMTEINRNVRPHEGFGG